MSANNEIPRFVRTQQDALQFATAFEQQVAQLNASPPDQVDQMLKSVKPPFKCADCRRKIQLSNGYKLGKDKLCENCAQTALVRGYQKIKRAETLTGRRLISGNPRDICEHFSPKIPPSN